MKEKLILGGLTKSSTNEEIKNKAFELVFDIRWVTLSTVDADKPAGRIFDITLLDDGNLYFVTAVGKPVYNQLMKNPYAVISGTNADWFMFRILGKVVKTTDALLRRKFFEKNPGTQLLYKNSPDALELFYFEKGEGELFHLYEENRMIRLRFGFGGIRPKQIIYKINENCTACGKCAEVCINQAARNCGDKYIIDDSLCLECGSCYRICPSKAVTMGSDFII